MVLAKLLFSVIRREDFKTFWKIKPEHVDDKTEVLSFVRDFIYEYKKFPEVETLCDKFDLDYDDTNEEPEFLYEELLKIYRKLVIEDAAKKAIRGKSIVPYQEAILKYFDANSSVEQYDEGGESRVKKYEEIKGTGGIRYLSTGNDVLDSVMLGYNKTDYILIGGTEGLGKTWFIIRRALAVSGKRKNPALFISGEMGTEEIEERLDCIVSGVNYSEYIRGQLSESAERKRELALKRLTKLKNKNIIIKDDCFTLADVQKYIEVFQPAMVFIDGLHLFSPSLDWRDMLTTSMKVKNITRKNKIPIMAVMHLKEDVREKSKASVGSFAYFKGARDPDFAMVMYQDDFMKNRREIGLKIVKGRKEGAGVSIITGVNYVTQQETIRAEYE